jgi:hypothetical protein
LKETYQWAAGLNAGVTLGQPMGERGLAELHVDEQIEARDEHPFPAAHWLVDRLDYVVSRVAERCRERMVAIGQNTCMKFIKSYSSLDI